MAAVPYDLAVSEVRDANGNAITTPANFTFTGNPGIDTTPPELVYRFPGPGATGVSVGTSILLTFSEGVSRSSFTAGFEWTSGLGPVSFDAESVDNGMHVTVIALAPLALATTYTVSLVGLEDYAGNDLATTVWTFTTVNTPDTTPPQVVSSSPANGATNVSVSANLSITFSEAIDPNSLEVGLNPDPGDGFLSWSNEGKTLTFDPYAALADDQQYTVTILPGGVRDLAGNGIASAVSIRFTTAGALAGGRITGTIAGDPLSSYADDPTGGWVFAVDGPIGAFDDLDVAGLATVAGNDTYDIRQLPDGVYIPVAFMDSNDDVVVDPNTGDAFGVLGVDFLMGDFEPDSVVVTGGGTVSGVDFEIIDLSAITGTLAYTGAYEFGSYEAGVGLFFTAGFDPMNPPDFDTYAYWPDYTDWQFLNLLSGFPDGSYYVGAYLDVNTNGTYDAAVDPAGFYGGVGTPIAIDIAHGSDANGIVITLVDPVPPLASTSVTWPQPKPVRTDLLERLSSLARKVDARGGWQASGGR
jgi:hypothetical protein